MLWCPEQATPLLPLVCPRGFTCLLIKLTFVYLNQEDYQFQFAYWKFEHVQFYFHTVPIKLGLLNMLLPIIRTYSEIIRSYVHTPLYATGVRMALDNSEFVFFQEKSTCQGFARRRWFYDYDIFSFGAYLFCTEFEKEAAHIADTRSFRKSKWVNDL